MIKAEHFLEAAKEAHKIMSELPVLDKYHRSFFGCHILFRNYNLEHRELYEETMQMPVIMEYYNSCFTTDEEGILGLLFMYEYAKTDLK